MEAERGPIADYPYLALEQQLQATGLALAPVLERVVQLDWDPLQHDVKIFHNTIVELRLLKFGRIIGKHLVEAGFPLEWVHVIRTADMPEVKHKITTATFEVKVGDLQISTGIIDLLNEISKQRPLSKFGVQTLFQVTDSERPVPPQYWYRNGRFWAEPELTKPVEAGLHLSSDFKPRVQKVLDMNPRPEGMQVPNPELDPQLNHETDP